ncbi:tRNA (adenosine(37)-N6)-threonylcarbamoyltransferase complex dimerization subunit type 1 TsaB [Candidatus Omnitrophota bacterium]
MKLLAIDTSTKYLALAVMDEECVLASFDEREGLKQATFIIPAIDKILKKAHLSLARIDAIALSIGPGSFTGLRIGVATAKGINLSLGTRIVAVPTLDVIAHNFLDERDVLLCPAIDAKKEKVYACIYDRERRLTEYLLIGMEDLLKKIKRPTLLFGDGATLYKNVCEKNSFVTISEKCWFPKTEVVGKLGLILARKRKFTNPDKLSPMYLHSQYCQVKILK